MKKIITILLAFSSILAQGKDVRNFPSLAPVLEKSMPSIVNVAVQGTLPATAVATKNKGDRPVPKSPRKFESLGSGVIIDSSKGYVITNAHVIRDATTITVTLNDGRRMVSKLIGADNDTDIAVLQIKAKRLKQLPYAKPRGLKVGDFVVAIGNPFGLNSFGNNQSATFGIVSALQRNALNIEGVENFIQTDAAINPGNSGGALINTKGELVGINTAIIAPYGGNVGIGFAIPVDMVQDVSQQLIKYGSVDRGLMGIFVQHLTPELATAFSLPEGTKGAIVTQVNEDSPAAAGGLKMGDIITKINDTEITDAAQVKTTIGLLRVGGTARISILRNGQKKLIDAVVSSLKEHEKQIQESNPFLYGLALSEFSQQSPFHGYINGIEIVGASESSAGWRAGLRPGDVIISANSKSVKSLEELNTASKANDEKMLIHILRGTGAMYLVIK